MGAEADLLALTDGRLFALPMDARRAGTLREDVDLGERVDVFVARFGRLQDTLADKLLPEVLSWLGEPVGPAIDNVARAEQLGWITDGQAWFDARQLRDRMIPEYVRDPEVLAAALSAGHAAVTLLLASAHSLASLVEACDLVPEKGGATKREQRKRQLNDSVRKYLYHVIYVLNHQSAP